MAHEIMCRLCKVRFDTNKEPYILVGQRSYYHKHCYEEWVKTRNNAHNTYSDADFWKESIIDYLYRDVKMSMDFQKINSQWDNFTKPDKKMTPKGIYFALRYYYDVNHGDKEKALGGIGIVPSIYKESAQYWVDLETRKAGTLDAIIEQIKSREDRPVQKIVRKTPTKSKTKFSLDDI